MRILKILISVSGIILSLLIIPSCKSKSESFEWRKAQGKDYLYLGKEKIGFLQPLKIGNCKINDQITMVKEGVYRITRKVENISDESLDTLRLTIDFVHEAKAEWLMIPPISYNGNNWGSGLEPKGYQKEGVWMSFSYTRTSIPGATYSEGPNWAVALWGELGDEKRPFSCSLMPGADHTTHRLIWPEEEMPLQYITRDKYVQGFRKKLVLQPSESITLSSVLVVTPVQPDHTAIRVFLEQAWNLIPQPEIPAQKPHELWDLTMKFPKENLWSEEGVFKGFCIVLEPEEGKWVPRPYWKYEIGWTGRNASLGHSFLVDYMKFGNRESLEKGLATLDCWAKYCSEPNGLFRTHFDYILGTSKGEERLDACNLGEAAINYLSAWQVAKELGIERENYKALALGICNFMVRDQLPSGQYGRVWSRDGKCLDRDGTIGAYLIAPMVLAYRITGDRDYIVSAMRAYDFYYNQFEKDGFTTAGALDTDCIDKESSLPLLRGAVMLFEQTQNTAYIEKAERTSWYLSTWLWHYSAYYPENTDFRKYGFDTFGGTGVSTQHPCMDMFGLYLVPDWLKLAEYSGNSIWKEKALAVWANGSQCIADGKKEFHGIVRPAGSQTEAYMQTHWTVQSLVFGQPGYFGDFLIAWPGAMRLEILRSIEDWKTLE